MSHEDTRTLIESAIADVGFAMNRVSRIKGNGKRPDAWRIEQSLDALGNIDRNLGTALDQLGECPGGGGSLEDAIDLGTAVIASNSEQRIARWPIVGATLEVTIEPGQICIRHEMQLGQWPAPGIAEGNPWVGAIIGGVLHFGTYEWLRPGQVCKGLGVPESGDSVGDTLAGHIKQGPLASWRPQPGETVYFFVSALARNEVRSVEERTNVVAVIWPDGV